ncbi:MAG: glycosyltransferase, partial [Elusimicrobiota bacterium]
MSNYCTYTIIIPSLNEKENLSSLLTILGSLYPGCSILVADDGSDDGTFEYISSLIEEQDTLRISFMDRKRELFLSFRADSGQKRDYLFSGRKRFIPGLNASLRDAFKLIETEKFAVIDGDFQHPLSLPGEMYEKLLNCDIVCAYRKNFTVLSLLRRIITRVGIT